MEGRPGGRRRLMRVWRACILLGLLVPALARADASVAAGGNTVDGSTFARGWTRACAAFARQDPCELRADLDGDGQAERVVKVRARRGGEAGLAVLWRSGRVSILGAGLGRRERTIDLDAAGDDQGGWRDGTRDLRDLTHGSVAPARRSSGPGRSREGLQLDGGDAAEAYYLVDGGWVAVILGF